MKVTFWGVRGSTPSPLTTREMESKLRKALLEATPDNLQDEPAIRSYVAGLAKYHRGTFGGNTACVDLVTEHQDRIIIDTGSGLRGLGNSLMKTEFGQGKGKACILVSHTHWDHIQGLPFFAPAYVPGNKFLICGSHQDLETAYTQQQDPQHFPVSLNQMGASFDFVDVSEGYPFQYGAALIRSLDLEHPNISYAYRIEADNRTFVYASDAEYQQVYGDYIKKFIDFFYEADAVVFDSQYVLREAFEKLSWGHSSPVIAVEIGTEARVKTLIFFHHEPSYDDDAIQQMLEGAILYQESMPHQHRCQLLVASEELEMDL